MDGENHVEIDKLIKEARKVINLTQDDLADLSGISVDTVRRIEAGKVQARLDSIMPVLRVLEIDFDLLTIYKREEFWQKFNFYKDRIDKSLAEFDLSFAYESYLSLMSLDDDEHFLVHKKINSQHRKSYEAIFTYTSDESRILLNFCIYLNGMGDRDMSLRIIKFLDKKMDIYDRTYPYLMIVKAYSYILDERYEEANRSITSFLDKGHEYILTNLVILFYLRGVARYYSEDIDFMDDLTKALSLCKTYRLDKIKDLINKDILKRFRGEIF